jgi:hypothetical protein
VTWVAWAAWVAWISRPLGLSETKARVETPGLFLSRTTGSQGEAMAAHAGRSGHTHNFASPFRSRNNRELGSNSEAITKEPSGDTRALCVSQVASAGGQRGPEITFRGNEMVRAYDQGSLVAFSATRWLEVALCVPGTRLQADHHTVTWGWNTRSTRADHVDLSRGTRKSQYCSSPG